MSAATKQICGCWCSHSVCSHGAETWTLVLTLCLQPRDRQMNAGAHTVSAVTGHTSGCWCSHSVCSHRVERWMLVFTLCLQPRSRKVDAGAHTVSVASAQLTLTFLFNLGSQSPGNSAAHIQGGFPSSLKPLWKCPHRYTHRCVSMVIPKPGS